MPWPALGLLRRRRITTVAPFRRIPKTLDMPEAATAVADPYLKMKEDPIEVLTSLWLRCSAQPHRPFPNLTGFLSKFDLWILAYQRSAAHFTGSFPAAASFPTSTLRSLLALQSSVLDSTFHWSDRANPILKSPADRSTRPLSRRRLAALLESEEPLFQDRVVQEILLFVLEPAFEVRFSPRSHAFRPGRNAHSVIRTIRSNFAGYLWFIKGDLTGFFDQLDVNFLMDCMKKVVGDKKVLSLIKSAARAGDLRPRLKVEVKRSELAEKWAMRKRKVKGSRKKVLNPNEPKPDPYWLRTFFEFAPEEAAKVPCYGDCGILSPLLANVCLNELDQWMEGKIVEFFCPNKFDSIWKDSILDGCHNPAWPEFVPASGKEKTRKMDYIRYGGHILIGIRGPRESAVEIRKELKELCDSKFGLRLDGSNLQIEHVSRGIQFLDHIICRRVIYPTMRFTSTGGSIVSEKGVGTMLSVTASLQQCIKQFRKLRLVKGDQDPEPLPCTPMLYSGQAHTNSQMNKFLETMADWYRYADNRKNVVGFCAYVIRSSLAKLYAARYRLKSRAKVYRIASRDLSSPLKEFTRNDAPEYSDLLRMGLVDVIEGVQFSRMSAVPSCDYTPFPRNWIPDHERLLQEYTKLQDPKFFYELYKGVKKEGLSMPQDEISKTVWNYKIFGARGGRIHRSRKQLEISPESFVDCSSMDGD